MSTFDDHSNQRVPGSTELPQQRFGHQVGGSHPLCELEYEQGGVKVSAVLKPAPPREVIRDCVLWGEDRSQGGAQHVPGFDAERERCSSLLGASAKTSKYRDSPLFMVCPQIVCLDPFVNSPSICSRFVL